MGIGLFYDDKNVLALYSCMVSQHCRDTKCHWILHFKMINFILCLTSSNFFKGSSQSHEKERQVKNMANQCEPSIIVSNNTKCSSS